MSLYPVTQIDLETALVSYNSLNSGSLVIIPLEIVSGYMAEMIVTQATPTQDFSMRVWISQLPDGIPVVSQPPTASFWSPNKVSDEIRVLYALDRTLPDGAIGIPLENGSYFINVLNLTNAFNMFQLSLKSI